MNVQARLANGCLIALTGNGAVAGPMRLRLTVPGDEGTLVAEGTGHRLLRVTVDSPQGQSEIIAEEPGQSPVDAFLAALLDGAPNISPTESAAQVVELTEAAHRSVTQESIVTVVGHVPEMAAPTLVS
ncbi:MAG TPA: hypothetical protein VGW38_11060 [Chloroflexota bacterium]|nr:hypothetical protein [Chloroflexota bacterium]